MTGAASKTVAVGGSFGVLAFLIGLIWAAAAEACVICVPYPTTTHADRLIAADAVLFAREVPDQPYLFEPMDALKGPAVEGSIKLFVASPTRRFLNQDPDHVLVLVRDSDGAWDWLTHADLEHQEFIRAIVERSSGWATPRKSVDRFRFFTERLSSENRVVWEQSYLEVARAPYSWIKLAARAVQPERIRAFLDDWRMIEWHSLFILMLGQSEIEKDREFVRKKFETSVRYGLTTNLSAWTTSYIEGDPEKAINNIADWYFAREDRTREELEAVVQALSVVGSEGGLFSSGRTQELRNRIVESYAVLLRTHPAMAGYVARDLREWNSDRLAPALAAILRDHVALDPASALSVEIYLAAVSNQTDGN